MSNRIPRIFVGLMVPVALSLGLVSLTVVAQGGSTQVLAAVRKPKPSPSPSATPTPTATPSPTPTPTPSPSATPSPSPLPGSWKDVPSQSVPSGINSAQNQTLRALAMISASDGWAVGWVPDGAANYGDVTLTEHWNGSQWSIVSSPSTNLFYNELWAVSADASTDVWAVGRIDDPSGNENTLVEHWDGLRWSIVPSPNPVAFEDDLYAVKAFAPDDVWAAGWYWNGQGGTPGYALVLHWNGTSWSQLPAPSPGTFLTRIYAMTATSASDIWTAGVYQLVPGGTPYAFASHWNGSAWTNYTLPTGPAAASAAEIRGLFALPSASGGSADVWAVGNTEGYTPGYLNGLCDHWDGTAWSNYPCGGTLAPFYSVSAVASHLVWAVGGQGSPAIAWWDGNRWTMASTSQVHASILYGVSALSASSAQAVGYNYNYTINTAQTAAEMYSVP